MTINDLLNKDVQVYEIERDYTGDVSKTDLGSFKGHLEFDRQKVFTDDHEEVTTNSIVYLEDKTPLSPQSEYELQVDGYTMTSEQVAHMEDPRETNKNDHWQLDCR